MNSKLYTTLREACDKIDEAAGLLRDEAPNPRDFAPGAYYAAADAHMAKSMRLHAIIAELAELAGAVG